MKKTVILIVCAVITIACMIFGTYKHFGNFERKLSDLFDGHVHIGSDGFDGKDGWSFCDSDDYDFDDDWEFDSDDKKSNTKSSGEIDADLEGINNIEIDARVATIRIMNGNNYHLHCTYNKERYKPEYKVEGDKLIIRQHGGKNNSGNIKCKIEITVPRNAYFNMVDVQCNVGEMSVEGFDCKNLRIINNVGEISVRDITFDDLRAETNVGEVSIKTSDPLRVYKIDAETNIGEVSIDGSNYKRSFSQKGTTDKRISAKTNVGEVSIR